MIFSNLTSSTLLTGPCQLNGPCKRWIWWWANQFQTNEWASKVSMFRFKLRQAHSLSFAKICLSMQLWILYILKYILDITFGLSTQKKLSLLHWFTFSATESDDFSNVGWLQNALIFKFVYYVHSCMSLCRILMPRKIEERRPNSNLCIFVKANVPIQKKTKKIN